MSSWGILGNPSPEKIEEYKEMPYGEFKSMVALLKKKSKGKQLKNHKVRIRKIESSYTNSYATVEAFTPEQAIEKVKAMDKSLFEWHDNIKDSDKYNYQVVLIE